MISGVENGKAKTIVAVSDDDLKADWASCPVLDVGSPTGIIANSLTRHFQEVVVFDI